MANVADTAPLDWQDIAAGSVIRGAMTSPAAIGVGLKLLNDVSAETRHMWRSFPLGQVAQAGGRTEVSINASGSYGPIDAWDCHVPEGIDAFTLVVRGRVASGDLNVRLREDGSTTVAEVTIASATVVQQSDSGSVTTGGRSYSIEVQADDAAHLEYMMVMTASATI